MSSDASAFPASARRRRRRKARSGASAARKTCSIRFCAPLRLRKTTSTLRYRTRLVSFTQNADLVTAMVENAETGAREEILARYIVGCDGARSLVRETLGIAMQGNPVLTYTTNVIFRCPQLLVAARQGQGLPPHLHRAGRHLVDHRRHQRPRRVALFHHRRRPSSATIRPTTSRPRSAAPSAAISSSRF